jgi:integrase
VVKRSAFVTGVLVFVLNGQMDILVCMKQTMVSFAHEVYLNAYHPRLPGWTWEWMRPFVVDLIRGSVDDPRRTRVERSLTALTGYLDWARQQGLVTSPDKARSRSLIDLYTSQRVSSVAPVHASRDRRLLLHLFDVHDAQTQFRGLNRLAEAPYSIPEIALIRAWASYQSTPQRTRNCAAIASFGLGCGLTAQEMLGVRGSHIVELADGEMGIVVSDGKKRVVPALIAWSSWLRDVRESTDNNEFVVAPGSRVRDGRTMHNLRHVMHGEINPVPLRLRNTWLVTHLDARTPVDVIARVSGAHHTGFPSRLGAYVRTYSPAEELEFLRGPDTDQEQRVSAHA